MKIYLSLLSLIFTESVTPHVFVDPCTDLEIGEGYTHSVALNYTPNATIDDGSCLFHECISKFTVDVNGDDSVTIEDILILLTALD